jgi:hypothetical protein
MPLLLENTVKATPKKSKNTIKHINGTWFSIQYPDLRHKYMNPYMARFSCKEYTIKIHEMAELKMEYIVLNAVTLFNKAFYISSLLPKWELECIDPVDTIMTAADDTGMKIFLTCEYPFDESDSITDITLMHKRIDILNEVAQKYTHHKSFYGWYFAREAYLNPVFSENFLNYCTTLTSEARKLTPMAKVLIAPFGTGQCNFDSAYAKQLDSLPVDIIAYQDEVGCVRPGINPETTARQFEKAYKIHNQNNRIALWADIETFTWEREENNQKSALVPANFSRILAQLNAVSPFVENILVYTAQGIIEKPDSQAPMGHPDATRLYIHYKEFLDRTENAKLLIQAIRGSIPHQAVGKPAHLKNQPSQLYNKGNLTNGHLPAANYTAKGWIGFHKTGLEAIVDMGKLISIYKLAAYFLQYRTAGIDLPHQLKFDISEDGIHFRKVSQIFPEIWLNSKYDSWTELIISENLNTEGRYIRIRANCSWEWLFIGEIIVNPKI